jgi:hypothetical protein
MLLGVMKSDVYDYLKIIARREVEWNAAYVGNSLLRSRGFSCVVLSLLCVRAEDVSIVARD